MRLIDADKVIKQLENIKKDNPDFIDMAHTIGFMAMINQQPTAYDVDKVVKELNEWAFNANINIGDGATMNHNLIVRDTAIEIVKVGGNLELSEHSKS